MTKEKNSSSETDVSYTGEYENSNSEEFIQKPESISQVLKTTNVKPKKMTKYYVIYNEKNYKWNLPYVMTIYFSNSVITKYIKFMFTNNFNKKYLIFFQKLYEKTPHLKQKNVFVIIFKDSLNDKDAQRWLKKIFSNYKIEIIEIQFSLI